MHSLVNFLTLLFTLSTTVLLAQPKPILQTSTVPTLALVALDNDALLEAELALRKPGRAPYFAHTRKVDVRPSTHGTWTDNADGTSTWQLRISSPNALSLNLGFTEYWMPTGGKLYLHTGKSDNWKVLGPFTPADNETHNELWTPIFHGEELIVEVILPSAQRANLRLWLTHVNHDYEGFGIAEIGGQTFGNSSQISGSCNLDVVCGAVDGWPIVDKYRDIIRSTITMNVNGNRNCSGVLINNTQQDGTPYFLTANHCGINRGNAASVVVFYNYENSTCRQPNTASSGRNGDGSFATFNTGAMFRAASPDSDMTLLELDDPINPDANAFLAGWDRTRTLPADTIVGIHHPNEDEKRISFTFQPTYWANGLSEASNPDGNYVNITDWDIGTTEPGSSGSPLFDRFRRIRGQLFGGGAACGNDLYDNYGSIYASWEGRGTPATRLRDWLDPTNTSVEAIDGRNVNVVPASVTGTPISQGACETEQVTYALAIGSGFASSVALSIQNLPAGLSAAYSQNPATPGSTVDLTISYASSTNGSFIFEVTGSDGVDSDATTLALNLASAVAPAPTTVEPAYNQTGVSLLPTLTWNGTDFGRYEVQLGLSSTLANPVVGSTTIAEFTPTTSLEQDTMYFWRVREINICGTGEWSVLQTFSTIKIDCRQAAESTDVPVLLPDSGNPTSTSTLTIDQNVEIQSLEVSFDLTHSWVGDMRISLQGPSGARIVLVDQIVDAGGFFSCSGDDLLLTFSDQALNTAADLQQACGNLPAASGEYQPVGALSAFSGESAQGIWTLVVEDLADGDGGSINAWSLTVCTAVIPLSVELTDFSVTEKVCSHALAWSVENTEDFSYFEVEKSADGTTFSTLGRVEVDGSAYSLDDDTAIGLVYYRLKSVGLDGSFFYSDVLTADANCDISRLVAIYPNPVGDPRTLHLDFSNPSNAETTFVVFGTAGRKLLERVVPASTGQTISLDVGVLAAGTYYLQVVSSEQTEIYPFVVM